MLWVSNTSTKRWRDFGQSCAPTSPDAKVKRLAVTRANIVTTNVERSRVKATCAELESMEPVHVRIITRYYMRANGKQYGAVTSEGTATSANSGDRKNGRSVFMRERISFNVSFVPDVQIGIAVAAVPAGRCIVTQTRISSIRLRSRVRCVRYARYDFIASAAAQLRTCTQRRLRLPITARRFFFPSRTQLLNVSVLWTVYNNFGLNRSPE